MQTKIKHALGTAIKALQHDLILNRELQPEIQVDRTRDASHGDYTTNIAMVLAKAAKTNPRQLAQAIIDQLKPINNIETIEIAGPGFINFCLSPAYARTIIKHVLDNNTKFGHSDIGQHQRVNIEFVSANPTGPLHVGHGRGAAFGATVANLLTTMGYQVDREYYVNDAGRQMHVLAVSIWLRYLSLFTDLPSFPASGYKGDYVLDIAKMLQEQHGEHFVRPLDTVFANLSKDKSDGGDPETYIDELAQRCQELLGEKDYSLIFDAGVNTIRDDIKEDLAEFGVIFERWFPESSLVLNGDIKKSIDKLLATGHIYNKDGALWFKATDFGDEKDRVVVRENGITTYFASDIGYHLNKYERGYDKIIDVFGADHHGYAPRIKAFLDAEGLDKDRFEVLLVQFAILYRGKQKKQMSTRSGEFVTLRELREEVGNDAARFFYIMRKNDQHLDFDLELAKSQSNANPVYYIQYAHARVCSVMRQLDEKNLSWNQTTGLTNLQLLTEKHEQQLIYQMHAYADVLQTAALRYEPHILANYLYELANDFHSYYNAQQFIVDDSELRDARLCLINAVSQLLANGLELLGVSAPEAM